MGFTLQMAPISLAGDDEPELAALLDRQRIAFVDQIDPDGFAGDLFEVEEYDGEVTVTHPEVGWSWWLQTQVLLVDLLGEDGALNALSIHAWNGVAVPGDLEPGLIGPARRRKRPKVPLLQKLLGRKPSQDQLVEQMVAAYGGEYENLHVVSGTRLLAELEAGLEAAGLVGGDPLSLYEDVDEGDDSAQGRCYLAMTCAFLKAGMERKHLVWWVK